MSNDREKPSGSWLFTRMPSASRRLFLPNPLPLRIRLLVLVAGTLVPMLVLTAAVIFQNYERAEDATTEQVLQVARSIMVAADRELQNQVAALEVLALAPSLRSGDFASFGADAERFLTRFPEGTTIAVAGADGTQYFSSYPGVSTALVRPEVLESIGAVFAGRGAQVSNVYLSRRTGEPTFAVTVPVIRGGAVLFAIAFNPPRSTFDEFLRRLDLPQSWEIAILDRAANHVSRRHALDQNAIVSAPASLKGVLEAPGDERLTETAAIDGTRVLTGLARSPDTGWVVAVGLPVDEYRAPAQRSLVTTLGAGGLLILTGAFFAFRISSQLVRAEAQRELLGNELNHRVKNTLASVQAIVWRGLRDSGAPPNVREGIDARLQALSSVHNVLSRKNWEGAHLGELVKSITAPYAGAPGTRVRLAGPEVALQPRGAIAVAMIVNELSTNAAKYGALSGANGFVDVSWSRIGPDRLRLEWIETGGPVVSPPTRTGYGTKFIERAVVDELHGSYAASFPPEGMRCYVEVDL